MANSYAQAQGRTLGQHNSLMANAAAAAGVPGRLINQGLGSRPAIERTTGAGATAGLNIGGLAGSINQGGINAGMQSYGALNSSQRMNFIAGNLRLQNSTAAASIGLLQQSMTGVQSAGYNPANDLLALISKQRAQQGHSVTAASAAAVAAATYSAAQLNGMPVSAANFGGNAGGAVAHGTTGVSATQSVLQSQEPQGYSQLDGSDINTLLNVGRARGVVDSMAGNIFSSDPLSSVVMHSPGQASSSNTTIQGPSQDFNIQSENFPALTTGNALGQGLSQAHVGRNNAMAGAVASIMGSRNAPSAELGTDSARAPSHFTESTTSTGSSYEQFLRLHHQPNRSVPPKFADGAKPAAIGGQTTDRFGMLGLLSIIKLTDHQDLNTLALGTDLTSLGLNLNSSENLYKTFVSPLAENPVRAEPEFTLPSCYRQQPPRLHPGHFAKFKEETLFYVFYSAPQDEAQLIAADELVARNWFWHKRYKCWMTHMPQVSITKGTGRERGSYLVFDVGTFEVVPKADLELLYDDVEAAPRLPRPKHLPTRQ